MPQDAREGRVWKVRLASWVDALPTLITRPVRKLIAAVTFGILASGSLLLAEIARTLGEPHLLAVVALAPGLLGVVAHDVTPPAFAVADHHLT